MTTPGSSWSAWRQHLAPGPDGHGMAPGGAAVLVGAALGGGQDEGAGLDRPGAQQHLPVGLAGGPGEGGGHGEDLRAGPGQGAVEGGKAHVVADRQAQLAPRRLGHHRAVAGLVGGGFAVRSPVGRSTSNMWILS